MGTKWHTEFIRCRCDLSQYVGGVGVLMVDAGETGPSIESSVGRP